MRFEYKEILGVALITIFFIAGAILSQRFSDEIIRYLDFGIVGMLVYVLAGIVATVIAPVSTIPLMPVATVLWGSFVTALLSVLAWTIGAVIAFLIARSFGRPFVARFVDLEKIGKYEKVIEGRHVFWNIVFLRMAVPVDILSYAIGLFSEVKLFNYTIATFIGTIPFAFVFAYAVEATMSFKILAGVLVLIVVWAGVRKIKNSQRSF